VAAMGFDYYAHGRQTGAMAKRIFEGADPAKTAVETQKELSLHINVKSAAAMKVAIPDALKAKADKIYE
jgi:putative ABC transport system substrate-binding protein